MNQNEINQAEWENQENWSESGSTLLGVYFGQKDLRTLVPKKNPSMGWTLNMARRKGVVIFLFCTLGIPMFMLLILMASGIIANVR